jgi:hypothetical protein
MSFFVNQRLDYHLLSKINCINCKKLAFTLNTKNNILVI